MCPIFFLEREHLVALLIFFKMFHLRYLWQSFSCASFESDTTFLSFCSTLSSIFGKLFPCFVVKLKYFGKMCHFENGCMKKHYFFSVPFGKNLISFSENISGKLRSRKSTRHSRSIFSKIDASQQNQPAFLFSHKYILLGFPKLSTKPPIFFLGKWNDSILLTSLHFNILLDFLCIFTIIFHMDAWRTLNRLVGEGFRGKTFLLSEKISQASWIRQKLAKLNEPSNTVAFWDVWKVFKREKAVFLRTVAVWKHRVVPFIAGPTSALASPLSLFVPM